MRSYIIVGDKDLRDTYINDFVEKNKIKTFNIIEFSEKLTIAAAREIKKILSIKTSDKRLILVLSEVTLSSQNALLKSLEELPESTDIVFSSRSRENFLSTVVSRSTIVYLGDKNKGEEDNLEVKDLLTNLIYKEQSNGSRLSAVEELFRQGNTIKVVENVILAFRSIMLDGVRQQEDLKARRAKSYILKLKKIYPLIRNNNVNAKLSLESIFLQSAKPKST